MERNGIGGIAYLARAGVEAVCTAGSSAGLRAFAVHLRAGHRLPLVDDGDADVRRFLLRESEEPEPGEQHKRNDEHLVI